MHHYPKIRAVLKVSVEHAPKSSGDLNPKTKNFKVMDFRQITPDSTELLVLHAHNFALPIVAVRK